MIKQPYQTLKWYNGEGEQQYYRLSTHDSGWQKLKYHKNLPPSFVIKRDSRGHLLSSWYMRNLDGTINLDMTSAINPGYPANFEIKVSDYDYLTWQRYPMLYDVPEDLYYYEVSDGIETWYSEVFQLCDLWDYIAKDSTNGVWPDPAWSTHTPTDTGYCLSILLSEPLSAGGAENYTNDIDVVYNEKLQFFLYLDFTSGDAITCYLEDSATGVQISDTFNIVDGVNDFTITPERTTTARLRFVLPNPDTFVGTVYIWLYTWHVPTESDCKSYSVLRWSDPANNCEPEVEHYLILDGQPHNNYTKIEENVTEDDQKNKYPLIQTLQKWYNFILASGDFMVEGLSTLHLMDDVTVTIETGYEINIQEINLESEPKDDYLYMITLDFREESCAKDSCGMDVEECCCPNVENVLDYIAGGTGAIPIACVVGTTGTRYLVTQGGDNRIYECNGTNYVQVTDEEVINTCVYDEDADASETYDQYWYYNVGAAEFLYLCTLDSVTSNNDGTVTLAGTAPQSNEFECTVYVQAQYDDGGGFVNIGDPVTLGEYDTNGITITIAAGNYDFRVRYYTHACDLSYAGDLNATVASTQAYADVYDAMTNKPGAADLFKQDALMYDLYQGGYLSKCEILDLFAIHTNAASEALINWAQPGWCDPSLIAAPGFVAYQGFTGTSATPDLITMNYSPNGDGALVSQNDITVIIGVGSDVSENNFEFGSYDGTVYLRHCSRNGANNTEARCNDATTNSVANGNGKAHFVISRGLATEYDMYKNLVRTNKVQNSTGDIINDLYICGYNNNGVAVGSNRQIRYVAIFAHLTDSQTQAVVAIFESYLDSIGTGLY